MVVGGAAPAGSEPWTEAEVRAALADQLAQGLPRKTAAAVVAAQAGWRKRDVYALA